MAYGMPDGGATASASAFISRFTRWAQQRPGITAVALVGSFARGTARPDSDVDLVVIADDPTSYLADTEWARAFGSVERMKREDWGAVQSLRVFYASGLEVEFGLASLQWASTRPVDEESARVMRDGAVILVDKQLRLAQLAGSMDRENILIRELQDSDSIEELTELLHRAYRRLLDMGLRYWATHQTVDDTRTRIAGGKCLVAVLNGRIVGTVTYQYPPRWRDTPWYMRADVACVSQFAVEPGCQRRGIGSALMKRVEAMGTDEGAAELALSTAEPAVHLIDYYARRGYRLIEHTDATLPHYRSVILSKRLIETPAKEIAIRPYQASDVRSLWEAA